MNLKEGKNYKLINEYGIWHDLYNPALGKDYPMRVYSKFSLLVDGEITCSPEDFWIITHDVDGTTFAQPMSGQILSEKLMTLGFVPFKTPVTKELHIPKYEFDFLRGVQSRTGLEWEFKGITYANKGFIDVLNMLGNEGWQMSVKTNELKYVLMREK